MKKPRDLEDCIRAFATNAVPIISSERSEAEGWKGEVKPETTDSHSNAE